MPDKRRHRGAHPEDRRLFDAAALEVLRAAVADTSWLLGRRYAETSALKLVGDHYQLDRRQRNAVMRCACGDGALAKRRGRQVEPADVTGRAILIDGYNVLTSVEAALAGGLLLLGRDGALRDIASMHGSFRKVAETPRAIELIGQSLAGLSAGDVQWYLDRPVSNSGRLKTLIDQTAAQRGWPWQIHLSVSPDYVLTHTAEIVATADSVILDRCQRWFNLARYVVEQRVAAVWIVDLSSVSGCQVKGNR